MKLRRFAVAALSAAVIVVALAAPAAAGGWAVVTLDALPAPAIAGQPLKIGFMIRQHGQTPWVYGAVLVRASLPGTALSVQAAAAMSAAEPGHYEAELILPEAGRWNWAVASGLAPADQPMPPLLVTSHPVIFAGGGQDGLAGVPAGRLAREARAAFAARVARLAAQPGAETPAEVGQALFLAKGCVVCHQHAAVAEQRAALEGFSIGPNLTELKADPAFLRAWLKDPSAVKPGTFMPTLGLSDPEIESLIAFLRADEAATAQR